MGALGAELMRQAEELAAITEEAGKLTRTFLTPEHRRAGETVLGWMRAAGMNADFDAIGNVVGRYEGKKPGLPALMLGSHLDTVRDAGRYDGILGVLTAIACVKALNRQGERPDFAIEVFGFADEEGVRFQSTLMGSRAVAGQFDATLLDRRDAAGVSLREALGRFGLTPERIGSAARRREHALAYVELHIEQGPVLESEGLPLGVVTSIAGAARYGLTLTGEAGHAGTVPMGLRRDALAAAAEAMVLVEQRCSEGTRLVGTVGRIAAAPGAINVIPGRVEFTLDLRAAEDDERRRAADDILRGIEAICERRGIGLTVAQTHENAATGCAPWLMAQLDRAVAARGIAVRHLPSGAGHDAMVMAGITDIGMLFVRCRRGVSHNPVEAISEEDAELGAVALLDFIRRFTPEDRQP